jgi:TIR domain/PASTA domain
MAGIFISYRRSDTEGYAGRLFEGLRARFGLDAVFFDVAGIEPGQDFHKIISRKVSSCNVLLVLIGRSWASASDGNGRRRLDDPQDFVRLETAAALNDNVPVIPVLLQGAAMPRPEQLPEDLVALARMNAIELRHTHWDSDFARLVETLGKYVKPRRLEKPKKRRRWIAVVATLIALPVGLIAWFVRVDVPAVVGLPIEDAKIMLTLKQLNYRIAESNQAATGLAPRVIQQRPPAGTGATKGSAVELLTTQSALTEAPRSLPAAAQDAGFHKALVGKWRMLRMYNGFPVDQETTFFPDGRASSRGNWNYTILGLRLPYAFSGTWRVKDGRFEYTVERSTITNIVPIGETFYGEVLGVTAEEFAYVAEGQTYVDSRVK